MKLAVIILVFQIYSGICFRFPDEDDYNSDADCGARTESRIIGGFRSQKYKWLWQAALIRTGNRYPYCAGVLINKRYVLTAAHCTVGKHPDDIWVRLGAYNFDDNDEDENHQDFAVAQIKQHDNFFRSTFKNDIAVVKLDGEAEFNLFVQPICLPASGKNLYENRMATITGWGSTVSGGPTERILRETTIPVWKNSDCIRAIRKNVFPSTICAGLKEGGRDTCQGDSGGPLMVQNDRRQWVVIGITSWGEGCGLPEKPGLYSRVTSYLQFIRENAR